MGSPRRGSGDCLQRHCCSCYSVHCPSASSCYGNRPFWASHISVWPCPVVGLLGATELFGKPFRALTWNTKTVYFLMRSSKLVSLGQTCRALLTLGHRGNSGLEAQGPVTRCPQSLHLQAPPQGHCPLKLPLEPGRGERGWALRRRPGGNPPDGPPSGGSTHDPLQKGLYGLEVAARCAREPGPTTPLHHIIAEGIPPLKVPPVTLRPQKSRSNGFSQRRKIQAEGAPLSHGTEMQMDGRTLC